MLQNNELSREKGNQFNDFLEENELHLDFSEAELALLRDEHYELDHGKVRKRDARLRFVDNLRFSFEMHARCTFSNFELDVKGQGFQSFLKFVKIRDRITHPKYEKDLDISDEDFQYFVKAIRWYESNHGNLMERTKM